MINFDHPDSLETDFLIQQILELRSYKAIHLPVYDFKTHTRTTETHMIEPQPLILVEGILIFAIPELRAVFDVKIFVDTDADIRFIRRLERDLDNAGGQPVGNSPIPGNRSPHAS